MIVLLKTEYKLLIYYLYLVLSANVKQIQIFRYNLLDCVGYRVVLPHTKCFALIG